MTEDNQHALALAIRQLSHRLNGDEAHRQAFEGATERRFAAIEVSRGEDRRELLGRLDRFEDTFTRELGKAVTDIRECGLKDHKRLEARIDGHDAKLEAQDQMLDDLAESAAEKRGAAKVWQGALSVVSNHPGLALAAAGLMLGASWAPRLFEAEAANAAQPPPVAALIAPAQGAAYAKAQIPPPVQIGTDQLDPAPIRTDSSEPLIELRGH